MASSSSSILHARNEKYMSPSHSPLQRVVRPPFSGPKKRLRSRTLGRVLVMLVVLGVLGMGVRGWLCEDDALLSWAESSRAGDDAENGYVGGGSVIGKYALGNEEYERQKAVQEAEDQVGMDVYGNGDGDRHGEGGGAGAGEKSAVLELMDDHDGSVMSVTQGEVGEGEPEHVHVGGEAAVSGEGVVMAGEGGGKAEDDGGKVEESAGAGAGEGQGESQGDGHEVPLVGTMEIGGF